MKYIKDDLDCNWNEIINNKGEVMKKTANRNKKTINGVTLPTIDGKAPYVKKIRHQKITEEIFEYIRRRHHGKTLKVGVIIGVKDGKTVKIGWSKCNRQLGDVFDKRMGLQLALNRALTLPMPDNKSVPTPNCIRKQIRQFGARCVRYFKDAKKIEMPA